MTQIDSTLPPYFIARSQSELQKQDQDNQNKIIEPYSELQDYLDKDDMHNLVNVLGSFAGKTSSGLLSFGEKILDQFVFKNKKDDETEVTENELNNDEDYIVPG